MIFSHILKSNDPSSRLDEMTRYRLAVVNFNAYGDVRGEWDKWTGRFHRKTEIGETEHVLTVLLYQANGFTLADLEAKSLARDTPEVLAVREADIARVEAKRRKRDG